LRAQWPPRTPGWLGAIKANNQFPALNSLAWNSMGWVPVPGDNVCAFISGRTILTPAGQPKEQTIAGVTGAVLPGSSYFTLPEMPPAMTSQWRQQVVNDLNALREHYVGKPAWS